MCRQDDPIVIDERFPVSRHLHRWGWRPPLGRGQFRLAALFATIAVFAAMLGLWKHWHDQQAPYRRLRALDADLLFFNDARAVLIDLSGRNVTDDQLGILRHVPLEMHLDLSGTTVTDRTIGLLIGVQRLEYVDLTGTKVTDVGLQRLVDSRPDVSVGPREAPSRLIW